MKDYSITVLYSGSKGNATLIRTEKTTVLIDAGRSARALCTALRSCGTEPEEISAIFLTHEHADHTAALELFVKKHPVPVHAPAASAEKLTAQAGEALCAALCPHPPISSIKVGDIAIASFPTSHDSVGSVGYRITVGEGSARHHIGYATDLGLVTEEVRAGLFGCETVVLESNYDEEMLKNGPYPEPLKRRIASRRGHLSNTDCALFATQLAERGTKRLILAHLSENNNLAELALGEVRAALAGSAVTVLAGGPAESVGF